jgi:hypothetical protein
MKNTISRVLKLLFFLSFLVMSGIGLLMAYGLVPGSRGQQRLQVLGWDYSDWGDPGTMLPNVFFLLATVNLVIVWAWLIRCAAKGDFLRLGAGLLVGAVIISILLFLTPSYCSRSPRLRAGEADSTGLWKAIEKPISCRGPLWQGPFGKQPVGTTASITIGIR